VTWIAETISQPNFKMQAFELLMRASAEDAQNIAGYTNNQFDRFKEILTPLSLTVILTKYYRLLLEKQQRRS
jgi:hypothetical protein